MSDKQDNGSKGGHPDADIHPEATGQAKDTVNAHEGQAQLTLYAGWFCPFVQRVWTVLEEKNIPYRYVEVNPYNKPESLLKLNPRGLVPTLEYDQRPLYESNVICQFIEDAYPGPEFGRKLLPIAPYEAARMRIWMDWVTSRFIPTFHRLLQKQPTTSDGAYGPDDGLDDLRAEIRKLILEVSGEADEKGPFWYGSEPMMIDFVVAPWLVRLWVFEELKGGIGVPEEGEGGDDEQTWKRWRQWLDAVENHPTITKTTSEKEHYMPIYQRYAKDKAQSELAKATRSGKGVP